jgi:hypothetical protein
LLSEKKRSRLHFDVLDALEETLVRVEQRAARLAILQQDVSDGAASD